MSYPHERSDAVRWSDRPVLSGAVLELRVHWAKTITFGLVCRLWHLNESSRSRVETQQNVSYACLRRQSPAFSPRAQPRGSKPFDRLTDSSDNPTAPHDVGENELLGRHWTFSRPFG